MTPFIEQWQPDQNSDQAEMLFFDKLGQIQSLSKNEGTHTHTYTHTHARTPLYSELRFFSYPQLIKSGGCNGAERHTV